MKISFCWVYNNLCSEFLLCNVIDFIDVIVESYLDKKSLDIMISYKICCSSLIRLLMALRMSLLRIDEASLFETLSSLKVTNNGYIVEKIEV